jgi:hypothetical protein
MIWLSQRIVTQNIYTINAYCSKGHISYILFFLLLYTKIVGRHRQCRGSGMFSPDPGSEVFHPGSRIPIQGQKDFYPGSGTASRNVSIFNPKHSFKALGNIIRYVHPGSGSWFVTHLGFRIQGSKRHRIPDPDPQHWIPVLYNTVGAQSIARLCQNLINCRRNIWAHRRRRKLRFFLFERSWTGEWFKILTKVNS